jgi:alpha-glucosidase
VKDQFMLGDQLLVAPMLEKRKTQRTVVLPAGKWKADDGQVFKGGKEYSIEVPISRLPHFERVK